MTRVCFIATFVIVTATAIGVGPATHRHGLVLSFQHQRPQTSEEDNAAITN